MRAPLLLTSLLLTLCPAAARAQSGFADLFDHLHLAASDQAKAVEWYRTHFGATATPEGAYRAMLGPVRLIFQRSEMPKPSQGSSLGLIGFSVPDVEAASKRLQAAGVRLVMPPMTMAGIKMAQVADPWGTLIDVVQDEQQLGLHHVGLVSPDPAATLAWFASTFGGTAAKWRGRDGIRYGGVWLFATKGSGEPSAGHSIDHIGFRPANVDASVAAMKGKNVKVTTEPRPLTLPSGAAMRLAFVESPGGVRIELVQRDNLP
jgi:catechol 2,3-dioxygenase-like lactoylglutathione lyase family enzyme